MMIERFGIDLRSLRSLVVKSRGHFRAGFDDIFADEQIVEIDAPGLTTPHSEQGALWQCSPAFLSPGPGYGLGGPSFMKC